MFRIPLTQFDSEFEILNGFMRAEIRCMKIIPVAL